VSDETLIKADIAEKAIKQLEELVVELAQTSSEERRPNSLPRR